MSDFTVEVKHDRLDVRLGKVEPSVLQALRSTIETLKDELVSAAQALAPVKSGRYRASIKGNVESNGKSILAKVSSNSPLAHLIETGFTLPPREILPNAKKALEFLGGGAGELFAAHVFFPGATVPGKHVIEGAFDDMQGQIRAEIEDAARNALQEI